MQTTSPPFWLMMVSRAIAVLPVWRSPMISSRWPRPIANMESIALIPVCSGAVTPWRSSTPGAIRSRGMVSEVSSGPRPSIGWPSASTMRPIDRLAGRNLGDAPGGADGVPLLEVLVRARG